MVTVSLSVFPLAPTLTLLFPVRFMVLPSAFSQVMGVLASSSPQVTYTVNMSSLASHE